MLPDLQTLSTTPMNINYSYFLKTVEDYIRLFYIEYSNENLLYHNHSHAIDVLTNAKLIGNHYQLEDRSYFIVCTAVCFHDAGYYLKNGEDHEIKSAEIAKEYLMTIGVPSTDIAEIENCILATKMPQSPKNLNEKIICDADLFNLGTSSFKDNNKLLKKEEEAITKKSIDGTTWRASSIKLLENHTFHTDYCQLLLNKTKTTNLEKLKNKQEEKLKSIVAAQDSVLVMKDEGDEIQNAIMGDVSDKKTKKKLPVKGIETMFKISASKNIRISEMADSKAHIMISVNSIIISVVLGLSIKNLEENRNLVIPTIILLAVNLTTIIYSVLATRPQIPNGYFTKQDVENKTVNLLYFGCYYSMNFKEYNEGLKAMMSDSDFLYGTLTKDTFWQGKVLGRKYRLLRISYTVFLYGIVSAVAAFAVAVIFFS